MKRKTFKKLMKERMLRSLNRVNILPQFILLLLFVAAFGFAVIIFSSTFLAYVMDNRSAEVEPSPQMLTELLEGETAELVESLGNPIGIKGIRILDSNGDCVVSAGDIEVQYDNLKEYQSDYSGKYYYFTDNKKDWIIPGSQRLKVVSELLGGGNQWMIAGEVLDDNEQDATTLLFMLVVDYIENSVGNGSSSEWGGNTFERSGVLFPIYMEKTLMNGEESYSAGIKANILVSIYDLIYFAVVLAVACLIVNFPLLVYFINIIVNYIGQKRRANLLYLDTVTGGRNWLYFHDCAEKLIRKNSRNQKRKLAVVSLRMEKYQNYCMCYSTEEGETLIQNMSRTLLHNIRKKECGARYSEAEFGMLLAYENEAQLETRVKQIMDAMAQCAGERKIVFNCGICTVDDEPDPDVLYTNAGIARKAINSDPNIRIFWFNEELKQQQIWVEKVEEHMENALNNGEFVVYLQPQYDAASRTVAGAEALVRWQSPTEGLIMPSSFIPIFERNGFIAKIDEYMLRSVAQMQARWINEGKPIVPISVNISRRHFSRDDLAEHLCAIVDEVGVPKRCIELELTESAFFQDKQTLIRTVAKLREYGFIVSMDDFGADYSSLNSLKELPLDMIKLDAGFFRGTEASEERGSVIVAGVIKLAKLLDLQTVAEGVESGEQVQFLADQGCDLIQGFYFAKPMPVAEFEQLQRGGLAPQQ